MAIELKNVCHTYMEGTAFEHGALENINLTIHENEFVGIIGHTGSGKSTLATHMNGIIQPNSGKVFVDGIDMSDKRKRKEGRAKVGMVFQYPEHQLFEETVEKDIAFGVKNMGLSEADVDERVREAFYLVGLEYEKFAEKSPFELSGGEKRRAALAGIIAMRPKYLVLDEPMAGLDPSGRKEIMQTIMKLKDALGCAVIMISHSMDDVLKASSRIIVMNKGKIVMDDTPREIFLHSEKLLEINLGLPQGLVLANELRSRGIDIPKDAFLMDELFEILCERLGLC
ncbi:MAG: energy-coupling factor transporter ATPase [Clostridiales bacterium]|nr:energy-coupling factor transporter ATPase [Clostridiales bacterium]